jgi:hypothetical protein
VHPEDEQKELKLRPRHGDCPYLLQVGENPLLKGEVVALDVLRADHESIVDVHVNERSARVVHTEPVFEPWIAALSRVYYTYEAELPEGVLKACSIVGVHEHIQIGVSGDRLI